MNSREVIIVGAGIGGVTLALALDRVGVPFRLLEAAKEIRLLGVGLNLLPHAVRALTDLELQPSLLAKGVVTREYCFFTRHGQHVYSEPRGRFANNDCPQISIHRGDLHGALLAAVQERCGQHKVEVDHKCMAVEQDGNGVTVHCETSQGRTVKVQGALVIACDGVHSVLRRQDHPKEAIPKYQGTMLYRGVTRMPPFLSGATMAYVGTQESGKLVVYPIRDNIDSRGEQLVNWVIELARPAETWQRDWNRECNVEDFIANFESWTFDWLDIPAMLRSADSVYEYPMVDQDPLPFWTRGRTTLLGDAAHPMMPRGSNGSAQAILDAVTLAQLLARLNDGPLALKQYEALRHPPTSEVVLANRTIWPDAILRVVDERTGGKPFRRIEDVISMAELVEWQERYRRVEAFPVGDLQPSV
ncbi:flavin-dependent oxidoreductase [Bradyrhizobium manausense]|uniref:flavin-dependent oxidoreductase n=1 Tax=Bradyrhizobium TaxID=374 RepID=UPI001BA77505|nr:MULTISPECIES: flavin-dependent oxidoreductase [Bradyrhizobium]MBR0831138.1 flavin-dependent oxidoreductase [Bradyrhizobium manausense]UVO29171.1 flavin-dependent oxidoreductase [Bradyrhizobium arachidis]